MITSTTLQDNEPSGQTIPTHSQTTSKRRMISRQIQQQHDQSQNPNGHFASASHIPPLFSTNLKSSFLGRRASEMNFNERLASPEIPNENLRRGVTASFREFLKKASSSLKPRRRNVHENEDRPRSAWARLRTATSLHSSHQSHSISLQPGASRDGFLRTPIPGVGNQPPKIPYGFSGSAARAAAAAENSFTPLSSLHDYYATTRYRHHLRTTEQQEDRESGIEIAVTAGPLNTIDNLDSSAFCGEISRVDFISKLPSELAIQILVFMDQKTLRRIATVSKQWLKTSQSRCIWREVFMREETVTYAASRPIPLGAGLGLPAPKPDTDWKDLYRVREKLKQNWMHGSGDAVYLSGHTDTIYCVQFDE